MTDTHELDATDRAILTAFREHESPPPGAARRVFRAVTSRIEEDDDPFAVPPAPVPWVRSIAISVAIAAAVLLAMRGIVTGAAALREDARATPAQAEHRVAGTQAASGEAELAKPPKPTPPSRPTAAASDVPAADETAAPEPVAPAPAVAPSRPSRPTSATAGASDLAADLELLAEAKRAADPTPRLALLRRHAKSHPKSTLAEERDVLIIETLCALGRTDEARTRATEFARRHPKSAFHARVTHSCVRSGG